MQGPLRAVSSPPSGRPDESSLLVDDQDSAGEAVDKVAGQPLGERIAAAAMGHQRDAAPDPGQRHDTDELSGRDASFPAIPPQPPRMNSRLVLVPVEGGLPWLEVQSGRPRVPGRSRALPVPPYHFPDDKTLRVGQNPPGANFDSNSILQV
jgi:hypothetical protein